MVCAQDDFLLSKDMDAYSCYQGFSKSLGIAKIIREKQVVAKNLSMRTGLVRTSWPHSRPEELAASGVAESAMTQPRDVPLNFPGSLLRTRHWPACWLICIEPHDQHRRNPAPRKSNPLHPRPNFRETRVSVFRCSSADFAAF